VGELVKGIVEAVSSLGDGEMEERSFRCAGLLKGKRWRWRNPHKALNRRHQNRRKLSTKNSTKISNRRKSSYHHSLAQALERFLRFHFWIPIR
jgi:hypothetical protein